MLSGFEGTECKIHHALLMSFILKVIYARFLLPALQSGSGAID